MRQFTKAVVLRRVLKNRRQNKTIALVATMGNLHSGHLHLIERAKQLVDEVIVSIFVNPTQFELLKDFNTYPRTIKKDLAILQKINLDMVFIPNKEEIYEEVSESSHVIVPELGDIFCGKFRPGHFSGVATIIAKLLNIIQPDISVFGKKDYQQLLLIKKMVKDLFFPVKIVAAETIREPDGLALSSRNRRLTKSQRSVAPKLYKVLSQVSEKIRTGSKNYSNLEADALKNLQKKGFKTEYFNIRDAKTLGEPGGGDFVVLAAVWLSETRLIDNIQINR